MKYPFPSRISGILLITVISVLITAIIMAVVPIEEMIFSEDQIENLFLNNACLVYMLMMIIITGTAVINKFAKQRLSVNGKDRYKSFKLLLIAVLFVISVHLAIVSPLSRLIVGTDAGQHGYSLFVILSIVIFSPILEEILFRGIFLNGLLNRYGSVLSLIVSSLLFALFHFDLSAMPGAFIIGVALGAVYIVSRGNLLYCIIAHSCCNATTCIGITGSCIYGNRTINVIVLSVSLAIIVFLVFCVKKNRLSLSSLVLKLSEKRTKNTDSDLVVIGEYYRNAEADIVKGLLNDNDIAAICVGEEHSRPYLNGVYLIKVLINKADYDKANMVLRNL